MGACATKSGDLKVKGEPPVDVEHTVTAPPVAEEGEKVKADAGVPPAAAAEADPADVSRRRSLSDLLKEDVEASDGEAAQEAVKAVTEEEDSAGVADGAGAGEDGQEEVKVVTDEDDDSAGAADGAGAGEAGQEEVKVVTDGDDDSAGATATDGAGAPVSHSKEEGEAAKMPQVVAVVPPATVVVEQDTAGQPTEDPKGGQEPGGEAQAMIEEKRVDPDSVQVAPASAAAPAPSAEGSEVADGASA